MGSVLTELPIQMLISKTTFPSTLRMMSDQNLWSRRHRKLTHLMLQVRIRQSIRAFTFCIMLPHFWCVFISQTDLNFSLQPRMTLSSRSSCLHFPGAEVVPFLSLLPSVSSGAEEGCLQPPYSACRSEQKRSTVRLGKINDCSTSVQNILRFQKSSCLIHKINCFCSSFDVKYPSA